MMFLEENIYIFFYLIHRISSLSRLQAFYGPLEGNEMVSFSFEVIMPVAWIGET